MGVLKIISKPDTDGMYLENVVNYIVHGYSMITGGFNICPECALEQMQIVKNYYGKTGGNGLVHFIISFNRSVVKSEPFGSGGCGRFRRRRFRSIL